MRIATLLVGLVLVAAGCGGTAGPGTGTTTGSAGLGNPDVVAALDALYQAAKSGKENTIIVYGPGEATYAPAYQTFMKRYPGLTVTGEFIFGGELNARLDQEFTSGRHVGSLQTGGPPITWLTSSKKRCEPYTPVTAAYLPTEQIGPDKSFHAVTSWPYGIEYNTTKVPNPPKNWRDLTDPQWSGKLVMEDPTRITGTANTFAHMLLDGRFDESWLRGLAANKPALEANINTVEQQLAAGQYAVNPVGDYTFHLKAKQRGLLLGFVFPTADGGRLETHYTCLLSGGPNPNASKLFLNWLFTKEGQNALSTVGVYGTLPEATPPPGLPPLTDLTGKLLKPVPPDKLAPAAQQVTTLAKQIFAK